MEIHGETTPDVSTGEARAEMERLVNQLPAGIDRIWLRRAVAGHFRRCRFRCTASHRHKRTGWYAGLYSVRRHFGGQLRLLFPVRIYDPYPHRCYSRCILLDQLDQTTSEREASIR